MEHSPVVEAVRLLPGEVEGAPWPSIEAQMINLNFALESVALAMGEDAQAVAEAVFDCLSGKQLRFYGEMQNENIRLLLEGKDRQTRETLLTAYANQDDDWEDEGYRETLPPSE